MAHAWEAGIGVLALTDHDTTSGLAAAEAEAERLGLRFVPGVEISTTWDGHPVHIVGLNFNPEVEVLCRGLDGLREFRVKRAHEIGRRLEGQGISGAYEGALGYAGGPIIGRMHFALHLVAEGLAKDTDQAFKRYLLRGKPGYVPPKWATLGEAITWIYEAGGEAVLAHPARYRITRTKLGKLVDEFKQAGGAGLEVVSGSHTAKENLEMAVLARKGGLLASMGSDFHGPEQTWARFGTLPQLPAGCTPIWDSWGLEP